MKPIYRKVRNRLYNLYEKDYDYYILDENKWGYLCVQHLEAYGEKGVDFINKGIVEEIKGRRKPKKRLGVEKYER